MAGQKGESRSEQGFLTGAWEWATALQDRSGGRVTITIRPTPRKGVWYVEAALRDVRITYKGSRHARYEREYPNADNQTLAGLMFAEMLKLDRVAGGEEPEGVTA